MIILYITGMLSCWLAFYLYCKSEGKFTNAEITLSLISSILPVFNLLGVFLCIAIGIVYLTETEFFKKEHYVKHFK
jgi:lipoprotein signal peptidase